MVTFIRVSHYKGMTDGGDLGVREGLYEEVATDKNAE